MSDALVNSDAMYQYFVSASVDVFDELGEIKLVPMPPASNERKRAMYDVSAVVGFSGQAVGAMSLRLTEGLALDISEGLLGDRPEQIDDTVIDCIGELASMIAGNAVQSLKSYQIDLSTPSVVRGTGKVVSYPAGIKPHSFNFAARGGTVHLEIVLAVFE